MDENAEKLLIALFAERNGKKAQLGAAAQSTGLAGDALGRAVNSLYTQGLVGGVAVKFGDSDDQPVTFSTEDIILTRRGVAFAEEMLGVTPSASSIQILQKVIARAEAPGWEWVREIADKALKEHLETA